MPFDHRNNRFKVFYLFSILSCVFILSCGEQASVKKVCRQFMEGRMALANGDSSMLQQITEDSLFTIIMLHENYARIIDAPISSPYLNIYPKSVEIKEDCATCLMSGFEYYNIHLCKHDGKWLIEGENGNYTTSEKISKARKKLADYKISLKEKPSRDSVFEVLGSFFEGSKLFFKTQEIIKLRETCDTETVEMIKRLYTYSIKRTGLETLLKEMKESDFSTFDVSFKEKYVSCKFYKEETEIIFHKRNGAYIITGFNGLESEEISNKILKERYPTFLRALRLIRPEKYRNTDIF